MSEGELRAMSRQVLADPEDRALLAHYHLHLRRFFPPTTQGKLETLASWCATSDLEQEAAAAFIAEALHVCFEYDGMCPAQIEGSSGPISTRVPLFRHRSSELTIALCPEREGSGRRAPLLSRGQPFFFKNLRLLDFQGFRARWDEATAWRAIDDVGFSQSLAPVEDYAELWPLISDPFDRDLQTPSSGEALVDELVTRRAALLREGSPPPQPDLQGRLVLSYLFSNASAGRAEAASRGYFDSNNLPPWDCWLAWVSGDSIVPAPSGSPAHLTHDYVLAWVAPERLKDVVFGVEASFPFVQWASGSPNLLPSLLTAEGFL